MDQRFADRDNAVRKLILGGTDLDALLLKVGPAFAFPLGASTSHMGVPRGGFPPSGLMGPLLDRTYGLDPPREGVFTVEASQVARLRKVWRAFRRAFELEVASVPGANCPPDFPPPENVDIRIYATRFSPPNWPKAQPLIGMVELYRHWILRADACMADAEASGSGLRFRWERITGGEL